MARTIPHLSNDSQNTSHPGSAGEGTYENNSLPAAFRTLSRDLMTILNFSREGTTPRIPWYIILQEIQQMRNLAELRLHQALCPRALQLPPELTQVSLVENRSLLTVEIEDEYGPTLPLLENIRFRPNSVAHVTFDCTSPGLAASADNLITTFRNIRTAYIVAHCRQTLPMDLDMVEMQGRSGPRNLYGLKTTLFGFDAEKLLQVFLPLVADVNRHPAVYTPFAEVWLNGTGDPSYRADFGFATDLAFDETFWKRNIRESPVLDYLTVEGDAIPSFFAYLTRWDQEPGSIAGPLPIKVRRLELNITSQVPLPGDFLALASALKQRHDSLTTVQELYVIMLEAARQLDSGYLANLRAAVNECCQWVSKCDLSAFQAATDLSDDETV